MYMPEPIDDGDETEEIALRSSQSKLANAKQFALDNDENEYGYFREGALENWAGPTHWKFNKKNSNRLFFHLILAQEAVEVSTPKPPRKKRKTTYIDFDTPSKTRKKLVKKHFTKPARDSETLLTTKMIQTQKKKVIIANVSNFSTVISYYQTIYNMMCQYLLHYLTNQHGN